MRGPVARRFGHGAAHLLVSGGAYFSEPPRERPFWRDVANALGIGVVFVLLLSPLLRHDDREQTRIAMLEPEPIVPPQVEPEPEPIPEPKVEEPEPPPPPPPPPKPKPVVKPAPPKVVPPKPAPVKPPPRPKPELARAPAPPPPAPRPEPVRTARAEKPRTAPVMPRVAPVAPVAPEPTPFEPVRSERGAAPRTQPARARVPLPMPASIEAVPDDDLVADARTDPAPRARAPQTTTAARPMPKALTAAPLDVPETTYARSATARAPVTALAPASHSSSSASRKPVAFAATSAAAPAARTPAPRSTRTGEPEAPTANESFSRRRSSDGVRGVPLGELRACRTDRQEDALKLRLLGAVTQPGECSSSAGWYRLVETKNLNSFLMWIERAPGRAEADRCDELRHALACFAGQRAGGSR